MQNKNFPAPDRLGRSVLSSKQKKRAEKQGVSPDVFDTGKGGIEISVDRMSLPEDEMVKIGRVRAAQRSGNHPRTFYGWAVLLESDAHQNGRSVKDSKTADNSCHADIHLPEGCADDEDYREDHIGQLADVSVWYPAPLKYQ